MDRFQILAEERGKRWIRRMLTGGGFGEKCSMCMNWGDSEESLHVWERKLPWLIPWIEVNQPEAVDDAVAGLREWSTLTDTAIVTTVPGLSKIYDRIRVPGLQIIPGVKTNDALDGFDDVVGWKLVSEELSDMAQRCGSDIVVLENETAVAKYERGDEPLNWNPFRQALEQLPKELVYWLWPAMTGENEEAQSRMERLCRTFAEERNVVFLDQSYSRPQAVKYSWSVRARDTLAVIVADALNDPPGIVPKLDFYGPGTDYWQDGQIHEPLAHVIDAPEVIIYPGAERFKEAAIGIRKALEVGG